MATTSNRLGVEVMRVISKDDPIWIRVSKRVGGKWIRVWADTRTRAINRRAAAIALNEVGTTENPPGSNQTRYGKEWRQDGVPWCGMAVASWWRRAGHNIPRSLALEIDYVPRLVELAKQKKNRLTIVHRERVKMGDAVAFDFDGGSADHVGLFLRWIDSGKTVFESVEGNTSLGNNANGGEVMSRVRRIEQVEAFVRKLRG